LLKVEILIELRTEAVPSRKVRIMFADPWDLRVLRRPKSILAGAAMRLAAEQRTKSVNFNIIVKFNWIEKEYYF
jgi:hypothetical protein